MDVKKALNLVEMHVSKHSNNKYQNTVLNTEAPLREPKFTLLTANKYMARYLANAGEKRAQVEDLAKACHFILFEIQNRLDAEEKKPIDNQLELDFDKDVNQLELDLRASNRCSETNHCYEREGAANASTIQSGFLACLGCGKKIKQ